MGHQREVRATTVVIVAAVASSVACSTANRRRRDELAFVVLAGALVLLRSFPATYYEGFFFDSDQAIVGLMARHLRTGHDFPLYYYGLNYLLGVQAWIIAPFFVVFRPTVAAMRAPLVILNIAVAVALVVLFRCRLYLRPGLALVAALPFIMPTPGAAADLVEAAGASVEPFAYVIALWLLRRRPLLFGAVLGFAVLHREFVLFAVPAVMLTEAATGELWRRDTLRRGAIVGGGCALVWLVVDDVKLHVLGSSVALQARSLGGQLCLDDAVRSRIVSLVGQALPILHGGRPMPLQSLRIDSPLAPGHDWIWWLLVATFAVMVVRIVANWRQRSPHIDAGLGAYLALVGVFAACAYPLSCTVTYGAPPMLRYLLFGLLISVGLFATFVAIEPSPRMRRLVTSVFLLWSAVNLVDNARVMHAAAGTPPIGEHRVLTDFLLAHGVRYATATYWDAYVVSFLSRERITVASTDVIRIADYQREVAAHPANTINLARQPCDGFATVASWCLQR